SVAVSGRSLPSYVFWTCSIGVLVGLSWPLRPPVPGAGVYSSVRRPPASYAYFSSTTDRVVFGVAGSSANCCWSTSTSWSSELYVLIVLLPLASATTFGLPVGVYVSDVG